MSFQLGALLQSTSALAANSFLCPRGRSLPHCFFVLKQHDRSEAFLLLACAIAVVHDFESTAALSAYVQG